jgi:hypothetical protein
MGVRQPMMYAKKAPGTVTTDAISGPTHVPRTEVSCVIDMLPANYRARGGT